MDLLQQKWFCNLTGKLHNSKNNCYCDGQVSIILNCKVWYFLCTSALKSVSTQIIYPTWFYLFEDNRFNPLNERSSLWWNQFQKDVSRLKLCNCVIKVNMLFNRMWTESFAYIAYDITQEMNQYVPLSWSLFDITLTVRHIGTHMV